MSKRFHAPAEQLHLAALATVIVNYRSADLVVDCLRSLADETPDLGPTVVVDNASPDDSVNRLAAAIEQHGWSRWCRLLALSENRGYSAGNNAGIRLIRQSGESPEFLLLLNPDTRIRPGAVRELHQFMSAHPRIGIAGSRLEDPDGTPQRSAFRFPSVSGEIEGGLRLGLATRLLASSVVAPPVQDHPHPTDWVAGASMMVRAEVIEQVGTMDESYFLYFEEVDFCRQARRKGWECWYVPSSRVVHLVGQTTGVTDSKSTARPVPEYWFESRRRYFVKNHGRFYARLADLAWASGFALWRLRRLLQRKPDNDPPGLLGDFIRFSLRGRVA